MKRVLLWLAAIAILSVIQSACLEASGDESTAASPGEDASPTTSPIPTIVPTQIRPLPTRNPGVYLEPAIWLNLVVPENALVNVQYPAFVEAEIVGQGIASIARMAGQRDADGRQRLLEFEPLAPEEANEGGGGNWPEGVHEIPLVWTAEADVLKDSINQEYVVLLPRSESDGLLTVSGSYQRVGEEIQTGVRLLIDPEMRAAGLVQDVATGLTFDPLPGDEFRPDTLYLAEDDQLVTEPGKSLVFDAAGLIGYERQLLPAGGYFLGISTMLLSSEITTETVDFIIEDVPLLPGYRAYLDPDDGFQFLYPAEWPMPAIGEGRLTSRQPSGEIELNITLLHDVGGRGADQLKREAIQGFGSIQVLFEDLIAVGGGGGLWTAYGYDSEDGPHTGVFVTLVDNEVGYIIDVDGRSESEELVLEIVRVLTDSWTFRPAGGAKRLGDWVRESVDGLDVAVPADFAYATLENGWHRYSDEETGAFVAIRMEAGGDLELGQRHRHWLDVAGASVDDFAVSDPYEIERTNQKWIRSDFSYSNLAGNTVMGSVVGKSTEGNVIFVWSEAAASEFEALDHDVFDVVTAAARPKNRYFAP